MASEQLQNELVQLEELCRRLYESTNPSERLEAENAMLQFSHSPDCLAKCQLLLEHSNVCYAQLLAATTLIRVMSRASIDLTVDQRIQIRNYALTYLSTRQNLAPFVTQSLTQLYAKITKSGWLESKEFHQVIPQVNQYFFQFDTAHQITGLQILSQVVQEINQLEGDMLARYIAKQRKISGSFRDNYLNEIFIVATNVLRASLESVVQGDHSPERHKLIEASLRLALNCLSFDFIGTTPDESNSDDLPTVQIPTSWRRLFLTDTTVDLFFNIFHSLPAPMSTLSLSCLVQIASVRRSLFSNTERLEFLTRMINGVRRILEEPRGLSDPETYHEFCRLLARFKANYQLTELTKVPKYNEVIALITNFTTTSLGVWQFAPNSIHYLLMLWQKLVSSASYCKPGEPHELDQYTPEVVKAYVKFRLESVTRVVQDGIEDPLEDLPMLGQQLEQLSTITRQSFEETGKFLTQLFDLHAKKYQELLMVPSASQVELTIQEGRLAWLVYIIGAAISGRLFFNGAKDEYESIDGDLAVGVIQLMRLSDSQLAHGRRSEKLELALLSFFEAYRKCYVGDQQMRCSKMYKRLSDVLGVNEESRLLSVFMRKIITNLKYWNSSDIVIKNTLAILSELSLGYSSLRRMVKLEEIQFLLNNHTSEQFQFLGTSADVETMKHRTSFYASLGRLLFLEIADGMDEKFDDFMVPLNASFNELRQVLIENHDPSIAKNENAKLAFIGLCRSLRGLVSSISTSNVYFLFFEWIYPTFTPVIGRAIDLWCDDYNVTTPALRLVAELVDNKNGRLAFDVSSPDGILLFKEVASIVVNYGKRLLSQTNIPADQIYNRKLKGISITFKILYLSLKGNINFAVFQLYGDSALNDLLDIFVKLFFSIVDCDILIYPKLSNQYYPLVEVLTQSHSDYLLSLEPRIFGYLLRSLQVGLTSLDQKIPPSCSQSLDHIVSHIYKWLSKSPRKTRPPLRYQHDEQKRKDCLEALKIHTGVFHEMLAEILSLVMYDETMTANVNLAKPLLGLILMNEEYFHQHCRQIVENQPLERKKSMSTWLENLMDGIARNLTPKNRDKFYQNVLTFKRELAEGLKKNYHATSVANDIYY
ncbi:Exportin-7, partial [Fragariocoptes setiger]